MHGELPGFGSASTGFCQTTPASQSAFIGGGGVVRSTAGKSREELKWEKVEKLLRDYEVAKVIDWSNRKHDFGILKASGYEISDDLADFNACEAEDIIDMLKKIAK